MGLQYLCTCTCLQLLQSSEKYTVDGPLASVFITFPCKVHGVHRTSRLRIERHTQTDTWRFVYLFTRALALAGLNIVSEWATARVCWCSSYCHSLYVTWLAERDSIQMSRQAAERGGRGSAAKTTLSSAWRNLHVSHGCPLASLSFFFSLSLLALDVVYQSALRIKMA